MAMHKISPFLSFATQAEEAANFYVSVFPNSRITHVSRYTAAGPLPEGAVMTVSFELDGLPFTALNGGPQGFNQAISFTVTCEDQAEVDHYWDALTDGGAPVACGWLTDRFGLSWQITPRRLMQLITDPDRAKAGRAMAAMMTMVKIDIPALEAAAG